MKNLSEITPDQLTKEIGCSIMSVLNNNATTCDESKLHDDDWFRIEWSYLGYRIINNGNGDGFVLIGKVTNHQIDGYKCHLGNFSSLIGAKKDALFHFMLERPNIFSAQIRNRAMGGGGCSHEYFLLKSTFEKEGIEMPKEITASEDGNISIHFNGKYFGTPLK